MATWFNANLCAYCDVSSGTEDYVDERLNQKWRSVLPVCPSDRAGGALGIPRTKRRTRDDAIQRSGRRAHLVPDEVEEVRMERGASDVVAAQDMVRPTSARDVGHVRGRR